MTLVVASDNFDRGYASDAARDKLPAGFAYRMKDWIPGLDARLRGRGGWIYTSPDLAGVHAGPTKLAAVAWAPFGNRKRPGIANTADHMIAVGNDGSVYRDQDLNGSLATYVGAGPAAMTCPPFWNQDLNGLVLPVSYSVPIGSVSAYTAGASTYGIAALSGTAPAATTGCSWGDYLLLANGDSVNTFANRVFTNRIWVSGVGTPSVFTVGTDFWDSAIPDIVALVPVRAGILVFGFQQTSLISGDIPPAGGNWSEDIIFSDQGCWDVRSIAKYEDIVFFANNTGVYSTDGVSLTDITLACGMKTRWQQLVKSFYNFTTAWTAAAGIYRNYYVISVHDANGAFVTCHVFDFLNHVAFEFTNVRATMFAHVSQTEGTSNFSGEERLFMAALNSTRVEGLHTCWTTPDTMVDADSTLVLPQLETPFYKLGGPGNKVFRSMRATYDVRSFSGSTPTLAVDYCTEIDGAYTNAGSLPQTTDEDRQKVDIRTRARGIGLRLTQAARSGHTTLSEIELDLNVLEGMR